MDETLKTCSPKICEGLLSAIFSPASECGAYALRGAGWPEDKPSGRDRARANRSLWPENEAAHPMGDTSGLNGSASSASARLAQSLANKLRPMTDSLGSTLFRLTWKTRVTPVGAVDIRAAGFGAPHIRQRLYFVAESESAGRSPDADGQKLAQQEGANGHSERNRLWPSSVRHGESSILADSDGRQPGHGDVQRSGQHGLLAEGRGPRALANTAESRRTGAREHDGGPSLIPSRPAKYGRLGDAGIARLAQREHDRAMPGENLRAFERKSAESGSEALNGFWRSAEWLYCRDQKYRPVEPGTFPLAYGIANRVGKLRGYGNALVAPQAEAFIRAYMEIAEFSG